MSKIDPTEPAFAQKPDDPITTDLSRIVERGTEMLRPGSAEEARCR